MTTERKTVVTLKKGVDGNRFMEEMNAKTGGSYIPDRAVEVWNEKPGSYSNYDFVMSKDEARELKNDSRVRDVRWGTKKECGYVLARDVYDEPASYNRFGYSEEDTDRNWGLYACNQGLGVDNGQDMNWRHSYTLTGKGVDSVIMDDGIETYHPDFLNPDGSSRVILLDWPEASGLTNIDQDQSYYSTFVGGHGTHCASLIGGNLYGWARDSLLYSLAVVNSTGGDPANWMFGVSDAFNMLREWHLSKNRPTICNMSYTYYRLWDFDFFRYRGTTYTNRNGEYPDLNPAPQFAMRDDRHVSRVTSVDSDVEDCIDAGVIMVAAAGNNYNYIDRPGGEDYNNYYERDDSFGTFYWCRGGTPSSSTGVITAGSIDSFRSGSNSSKMHFASGRGPGVDVWAPGTNVGAATSLFNTLPGIDRPYPPDPAFLMTKLTGTSFAGPQLCGILAQHMELHPELTTLEAKKWIEEHGDKDELRDDTGEDIQANYANDSALNGAPNLFLRNPYASGTVARYTGDIEISK